MSLFRSSNFDKLLDKATNSHLMEPDYNSTIQICDLIRGGDCPPKYALGGIKKKLFQPNAHTANFALLVLESVVKNCGHIVHDEVCTKAFMEGMRDLVKSAPDDIKNKALELIQAWAYAFRNIPKYRAVQDMVNTLKAEGHSFPPLKESDAMFDSETAPEWVDASECHRCRVQFTLIQRKHHCRACGNSFCGQCSSKTSNIPKYGIEKEVRVCDNCYEISKKSSQSPKPETEQLPAEYVNSSLAQQKQSPKQKTAEELQEEDEFNLALALSQSEAEAKEMEKKKPLTDYNNSYQAKPALRRDEDDQEEEELSHYLNRSHWEQKAEKIRSSSPDRRNSPPSAPETPTYQVENGLSDVQLTNFINHLRGQVEIFVNRMKSDSARGRSIANDSYVQDLFFKITAEHKKMLDFIQIQENWRVHFEGLQDKLAQVKDAVAALDDLRNEHQEKLRREAEEAERIKYQQMAHKLQIMRKKKQEYLQQQRVIALQRLQEQEREMQMRKQQQQYGYMMGYSGANPGYAPHPGYNQPPYVQPGYPPGMMHPGMGGQMQGSPSLPPHLQNPGLVHQQGPNIQSHFPPMQAPAQMIPMQNPGQMPQSIPSPGQMALSMQNPGQMAPNVQALHQMHSSGQMAPSMPPGQMPSIQHSGSLQNLHGMGQPPMQMGAGNMPHMQPTMPMQPYPGQQAMQGNPQYQQQQSAPQEQPTAELIRFD